MSEKFRSLIIPFLFLPMALFSTSFKPEIGTFNRVDDFRYGLKISYDIDPFTLGGGYTYTTGRSNHYYTFDVTWHITKKWWVQGGVYDESRPINPSFAGRFMTTLGTLLAKEDYNDYMHYRGYFTQIGYRYNRKFSAHIRFYFERHENLSKTSDYSFFKKKVTFRENPSFSPGTYLKSEISLQFANLSNPLRPVWGYKVVPDLSIFSGDKVFYKAEIKATKYIKIKRYQRFKIDLTGIYIDKGAPFEELYSFSGFRQLPGIGIREYILDRAVMMNVQYNFDGKIMQFVGDWWGKNMELAPALNAGYGELNTHQITGQSGTGGIIPTISLHLKDKYDLFEFVFAQRLDKKAGMRFYLSIELFDLLFGNEE